MGVPACDLLLSAVPNMSDAHERPNLFFRLTTFAGTVFVVTILALVAAIFSDPEAPAAQFLHAHGTTLIVWEVAVTLLLGVVAMAVDRRQILRQMRRCPSAETEPSAEQRDAIAPERREPACGPGASQAPLP